MNIKIEQLAKTPPAPKREPTNEQQKEKTPPEKSDETDMVKVICPHCGQQHNDVLRKYLGRKVTCKNVRCKERFIIQEQSTDNNQKLPQNNSEELPEKQSATDNQQLNLTKVQTSPTAADGGQGKDTAE